MRDAAVRDAFAAVAESARALGDALAELEERVEIPATPRVSPSERGRRRATAKRARASRKANR